MPLLCNLKTIKWSKRYRHLNTVHWPDAALLAYKHSTQNNDKALVCTSNTKCELCPLCENVHTLHLLLTDTPPQALVYSSVWLQHVHLVHHDGHLHQVFIPLSGGTLHLLGAAAGRDGWGTWGDKRVTAPLPPGLVWCVYHGNKCY